MTISWIFEGEREKENKNTDENIANYLICQLHYLSLVNMNGLGRAVGEQSLLPPFPSDPTLLVAREVPSWMRLAETIEPHTPDFKLPANSIRTRYITGKNASPKPTVGTIDSANHFVFAFPR